MVLRLGVVVSFGKAIRCSTDPHLSVHVCREVRWIRSDGEINVCASANNRCASKYAVPILWADVVVQAIGSHCFHRWRAETQLLLFYLYDMVAPVCLEHYLA